MAKITGVLKGAKGKLAGFTLQKGANGNTIMRETVTPKNPNTELQKVQRAVIGTVGKAYSALKPICDHSFEGYSNGAKNMNRFRSLNSNKLRAYAASQLEDNVDMTEIFDFNTAKLALNEYIMSEGSLPRIPFTLRATGVEITPITFTTGDGGIMPTYADVCSALGLKRGDQLTFCFISTDEFNEKGFVFDYCRVILSPVIEGDLAPMSTPFLVLSPGSNDYAINAPNPRNQKADRLLGKSSNGMLAFRVYGMTIYGCTLIASRKVNDAWLRSPSVMMIDDTKRTSLYCVSLHDAISKSNSINIENNTLYLNNATD